MSEQEDVAERAREEEKKRGAAWLAKVEEATGDARVAVACTLREEGVLGDLHAWVRDTVLPILRDVRTYLEILTAAQARGTELQDEVRALRRVLSDDLPLGDLNVRRRERGEQFRVLVDLLKTRWRGDAKYGGAEAHTDLPLDFNEVFGSFDPHYMLSVLRQKKKAHGTGHASWRDVVLEEFLELLTAEGDERVEAEAIDVANVCLKMVEARRIRRAREADRGGVQELPHAAVVVVRGAHGTVLSVNTRGRGWSLPGGKVEPGETPEQAVKREVLEETDVELLAFEEVFSARHVDGGRVVHVFEAYEWRGGVRAVEADTQVSWCSRELLIRTSPFRTFYALFWPRLAKRLSIDAEVVAVSRPGDGPDEAT